MYCNRMNTLRICVALVLSVLALAAAATVARADTRLVLQLRWDHQFQFAGYYAALWNGYYDEAGLNVELRSAFAPDGTIRNAITEVAEGRADFGIGAADILIASDRGTPLVVLASIFQHSAVEYYALADTELDGPADLARLRVVRRPGDLVDVELQVLLSAEGIDPASVPAYPFSTQRGYLADLAVGIVDVIPGYSIGTPYEAERRGMALRRLRALSYGIDFYGDSLFTSAALARRDPELVAAFVAASRRGWRYALDNPQHIVTRLARDHHPTFPISDHHGLLQFQVGAVTRLTLYPVIEPGHVNPHRWRRMHDMLLAAGLVSNPLDLDAFVFDPEAAAERRARLVDTVLTWAVVCLAGLLCVSMVWLGTQRRSVHAATCALRQARDEAEQANAAKTRFLAAASHDLRQPLQALVLYQHVLTTQNRAPKLTPVIGRMGEAIEAQQHMLNALLDISRLDAGIIKAEPGDVAIGPLLRRLGDEFAGQARGHGLDLRVVPCRAMVRSDPALLERMLRNLLSNAIRYTVKGRVLLGCRRSGPWLRVIVQDTGPGIPPDQQAAVFEEFRQLGNPAHDRGQGLGLGLSIVQRLGRLLGHRIELRSAVGRGTAFSVELPLTAVPPARPATAAAGGAARPADGPAAVVAADTRATADATGLHRTAAGRLVAVIDDDTELLAALALALEGAGFTVIAAADEAAATTRLAALGRAPDMVVADYRLAHGDTGIAAVERLRRAHGVVLPAILLTGDTSPDRLREAKAGGLCLLHKPVAAAELVRAIERILADTGRAATAGEPAASACPVPRLNAGHASG